MCDFWRRSLSALALGCALSTGVLLAQSTTAEITGKVEDQSGAVVPAAFITVANIDTGIKRDTQSNDSGNYALPLLQPGRYRMTVQKDGFKAVSRSGIELQVNQVARIDVVLDLGNVSETVNVVESVPLLAQETSSLGQVIDNAKVENMPLNGRSSFRLVQLTPGILSVPSTNGQFNDVPVNTLDDSVISINGGRFYSNEILIDGVPSTTGFANQMTTIPSVDATQEFKVQSSNLSAEWGRFGGGVINVSTKSGANQLHGSLFEFLRNDAISANEFFNKRAGKDQPPFRMNQFGFSASGPVWLGRLYNGRNRTFFFTDYQGTRWRQGAIFITTVPTPVERTGDFSQSLNNQRQVLTVYDPSTTRADPSRPGQYLRDPFPGNMLPGSRIDPVAAKMIGYYPLPNTQGDPVTHVNNFVSNAPRGVDQAQNSARIDHNVSDRERIFGRFSVMRSTLAQPDYFGNPGTPGVGANGKLLLYNYSGALDSTTTLSPTLLASVRYGYARFYWARPTRSYGFDQAALGYPSSLLSQFQVPVFPIVNPEGYSSLSGGQVLFTAQDTHSLLASLTRISGRHTVKTGIDLRLRRLNDFNLSNGGGSYTFTKAFTRGPDPNAFTANAGNGIASLLLGSAASGSANIAASVAMQGWYYAGYLQDDFRVSDRLTLNFGLRYETEAPLTDRYNQINRFDFGLASPVRNPAYPNLTGGLVFAGASAGGRSVYGWDKNNVAPRFGFAYKPLSKTVLRGGAGVFYAPLDIADNINGFSPSSGYSSTTPFLASLDGLTTFLPVSNPFPNRLSQPSGNKLGAATVLGQSISVWDSNPATPYSMQWNLDVQRELPGQLLVDVAYTGSRGVKLTQNRQFDALNPTYLSLGAALQTLVDNPFVGAIPTGTLSQPKVARRQLLLPYPQFTGVTVINDTSGNSIYHAMNVKVEKRATNGVGFLLSYTFGKLISDVSAGLAGLGNPTNAGLTAAVQDPYNLRPERALSELDTGQSLSLSFVADLPFGAHHRLLAGASGPLGQLVSGWQFSGVTSYRGGYPLILTAPITGGGNRPNSTGKSAALDGSRARGAKVQQWFNTSAFTVPAAFTFGNVSRTSPDVRGPAMTNFDLALAKATRIRERVNLVFRAESFNAMNTPHLWLPDTNAGSLTFGQISSTTGNPRVNQLALKLVF